MHYVSSFSYLPGVVFWLPMATTSLAAGLDVGFFNGLSSTSLEYKIKIFTHNLVEPFWSYVHFVKTQLSQG